MVIRREYNSIFAIVLSFIIVEHIQIYFINGKIGLNMAWIYSGAITLVFWLTIRFLKRFTGILEEKG
ncbi:MAG: hypothetical protein ACUVWN_14880 [bacterium]